jgi:hypothetical protein
MSLPLVLFKFRNLRRENSSDATLMAPQTPMKIVKMAQKMENHSLNEASSAGEATAIATEKSKEVPKEENPKVAEIEKPKRAVEDAKKVVAEKPIKKPAEKPIEKPAEKPIEKPAEKPKEVEVPKIDPPVFPSVFQSFNQGPRTAAPHDIKKKLEVPKGTPAVVKDTTSTISSADLNGIRRNHQQQPEKQTTQLPGARPKLTVPKPQPKIFYNDMSVRELSAGKHKVSFKMFYLIVNYFN